MRIHRLIFRLDFQRACLDMLDQPGRVMRMLQGMGDDFWPEFKDAVATRTIASKAIDESKGTLRQITIEPTEINFVFETVSGLELQHILTNETVGTLFKGVAEICDYFKIDKFSRAGVRFFVLGSLQESTLSPLERGRSLIDGKLCSGVAEIAGEIKDVGLAFDGSSKDGLMYHLRLGPYISSQASEIFSAPKISSQLEDSKELDFMADIDFYEQNFQMTIKPSQWCKEPINKAGKLIEMISRII